MKIHKLLQLLRDNGTPRAEGRPAIRAEVTDTSADVYVYDVIDAWWGCSAAGLIEALAPLAGRDVTLHINSPGGDVFEGRAMASAIVAHTGKVTTCIDGLCASAATYLAMAGNTVNMTQGGMLMIHNGWTLGYGDKTELMKTADLLGKIDSQIAADYARRTGTALDQITAWMDAETWFTEQEALDAKFIDAIVPNTRREADAQAQASAARWNLSAYANAPKPKADPSPTAGEIAAQALAQQQANRNRLRLYAPN